MGKEEPSNQLNLTVVALVALVAIVGLVALVMNAASIGKLATGSQAAYASDYAESGLTVDAQGNLHGQVSAAFMNCYASASSGTPAERISFCKSLGIRAK